MNQVTPTPTISINNKVVDNSFKPKDNLNDFYTRYKNTKFCNSFFSVDTIEEFYGKGTKIKIRSLSYSLKSNILLVDAVVVLGEIITEEVLETTLAEVLILDSMKFFYPDYKVNTMVKCDV